jgi:hypothetical protein
MSQKEERNTDLGPTARKSEWHLDKKIPISLILVLLVYGYTAITWSSQIDVRMAATEKWIDENKSSNARLGVIEERLGNLKEILEKIERKLK